MFRARGVLLLLLLLPPLYVLLVCLHCLLPHHFLLPLVHLLHLRWVHSGRAWRLDRLRWPGLLRLRLRLLRLHLIGE